MIKKDSARTQKVQGTPLRLNAPLATLALKERGSCGVHTCPGCTLAPSAHLHRQQVPGSAGECRGNSQEGSGVRPLVGLPVKIWYT